MAVHLENLIIIFSAAVYSNIKNRLNNKSTFFIKKRHWQIQTVMWALHVESTCDEIRQIVIDVHEAVGAGVGHASIRVSDQFFPGGLCYHYIIVFQPAFVSVVIDVGPVMASGGLSLMNENSV